MVDFRWYGNVWVCVCVIVRQRPFGHIEFALLRIIVFFYCSNLRLVKSYQSCIMKQEKLGIIIFFFIFEIFANVFSMFYVAFFDSLKSQTAALDDCPYVHVPTHRYPYSIHNLTNRHFTNYKIDSRQSTHTAIALNARLALCICRLDLYRSGTGLYRSV